VNEVWIDLRVDGLTSRRDDDIDEWPCELRRREDLEELTAGWKAVVDVYL